MIDTDIRNRLKAEIMSLTDEQVEYVMALRRVEEELCCEAQAALDNKEEQR